MKPELKDILNEYNTLGSDKKIALAQSEKWDKKYLFSLFALTAISLAYRFVEEGMNPWDERSKAAKYYSYKNKDVFMKIFKKYSGLTLPELLPGCCYMSKLATIRMIGSEYMEWLHIIESEHPTILQSFFRGMTAAFSEELSIPNETFPFI